MIKFTTILAGVLIAASSLSFAQSNSKARKWTASTLPQATGFINSIGTDGKVAVAAGVNGLILRSSDGKTWTKVPSNVSSNLYSVDYDATTKAFYISGGDGLILRSPNGVSWSKITNPNSGKEFFYLLGVARAGGKLIAAGTPGSFLSSKDGKTWTKVATKAFGTAEVRPVSFGKSAGLIEYYSESVKTGQIWTTKDGSKLTKLKKNPEATHLTDGTVFNGSIYVSGWKGKIYATPLNTAGGSWKSFSTPLAAQSGSSVAGLASSADSLTAVGDEGMVFTLFKNQKSRSETVNLKGKPILADAVYFKNLLIVAGGMPGFDSLSPAMGFIAHTSEK